MSTPTATLGLLKPAKSELSYWSTLNSDLDVIDSLFSTASYTQNSLLFINSSGQIAQSNAQISWNTSAQTFKTKRGTNPDSTGQPSGTYAATIYNATNLINEGGLFVKNNWLATTSNILEMGNDFVGGAYQSLFSFDGGGNFYNRVGGIVVGSPTGGLKSNGSINAVTVWRNGTSLDKVFESDYELFPLDQLREYYEKNRTLPTIPRNVVEGGSVEVGRLENGLWESIECQARYIANLHERISALEAR